MAYDICQGLVVIVMMECCYVVMGRHLLTPGHERAKLHGCAAPGKMAMALVGATQACTCGCSMSQMHVQGATHCQPSTQLGPPFHCSSILSPSYVRFRRTEM
ncbi:hypothetical protein ABBQ32_002325 [Trebouxia sp. C0010 RCD-2024]